jgi:uncharacterized protein YaiE (UPF0345 family)
MLPVYGAPTVPSPGAVIVNVALAGSMTIDTVPVLLLAGLLASVAFTVTGEVPGVVGVPLNEQFVFSVKPAGTVPLTMAQVYGPVPPLTPTLPVNGDPTVPAGGAVRVSVAAAELIVIATGPVVVFAGLAESVAFTVGVDVPAAVGVPLNEQFAFSVKPAGTVPLASEHVYGAVPPFTPTVPVYAVPTVPFAGAVRTSVTLDASIVMETGDVTVLAGFDPSVAFTVGIDVPAAVGVPLNEQFAFSVRPAGTAPLTSEHA